MRRSGVDGGRRFAAPTRRLMDRDGRWHVPADRQPIKPTDSLRSLSS